MNPIPPKSGPQVKIRRLNTDEVHAMAFDALNEHVPLDSRGEQSSPEKIWNPVLAAAAAASSIDQECANHQRAPSANLVRLVLHRSLELSKTERDINRALAEVLERRSWTRPQMVAVDLHEQPYHGQPQSDPTEVRRGKAKSGTTHFHGFATAFIIRHGKPVTLALHFVRAGEPLCDVLESLKKRLDELGICVELWLADKAFCSVKALRWFHRQPLAYVPLVARGRKNPVSPIHALLQSRANRFARHTLRSSDAGAFSFDVAAVRRPARRSRGSGRMLPPVTLLYCVVGQQVRCEGVKGRSARDVYEVYRKRFGVETSYRQLEQGRFRTTSRSPVLRLLAVGVALLLTNLWALCRWICSAHPGPGRRRIRKDFQLTKLLRWISNVVSTKLHYNQTIELHAPSVLRF